LPSAGLDQVDQFFRRKLSGLVSSVENPGNEVSLVGVQLQNLFFNRFLGYDRFVLAGARLSTRSDIRTWRNFTQLAESYPTLVAVNRETKDHVLICSVVFRLHY